MQRQIAWIAAWAALALGARASNAQEQLVPGNLVARSQWSRLDVIGGRLQLVQLRLGQKATLRFEHPATGSRESLTFSAESPTNAALQYEYTDARQHLTLDVTHRNVVTLQREPRNGADVANVRFSQPARGALKLVVDAGHGPQEVPADSLWHLLLAEPDLCRQHLVPLLEGFRSDWRLEAKSRQVEESLVAVARSTVLPDTERMASLVERLRDPEFQSRQTADRELREAGTAVLPYLERLPDQHMDAEQRLRLRRIRQSLTGTGEDTPVRVASRLAGDPVIWLTMLERSDAAKQTLATQRLTMLAGRPISVNPEATAAERRQQAQRLRAELGFDPPIQVGRRDDGNHWR